MTGSTSSESAIHYCSKPTIFVTELTGIDAGAACGVVRKRSSFAGGGYDGFPIGCD